MKIEPITKKQISEEEARARFTDYASSAAFALVLTKRQITFLIDLHDAGQSEMVGHYSRFISNLRGCERRGLVGQEVVIEKGRTYSGGQAWHYRFYCTEAGRLVVALLKLAGHTGMIRPRDAQPEPKNKRRKRG